MWLTAFKTRPGRLLHALGNLRAAQGRWDESFEWHQKSLESFAATIGTKQHRYADICHIIAEHLVRKGRFEEALYLLLPLLNYLTH